VVISTGDVVLLRRTTFTRTHSLITALPPTTAFRFSLPKPPSYTSASRYCHKRIRQLRFSGKLFFILNFILHMLFLLHFPNSIILNNYLINVRVTALFIEFDHLNFSNHVSTCEIVWESLCKQLITCRKVVFSLVTQGFVG